MARVQVSQGSKYLGMVFNGWKVVGREVKYYATSEGSHSTFTLKKKRGLNIYTMTLSDREMTQLTKHGKNIDDTITGKQSKYCLEYLHRVEQNTIKKHTSLFNLFRKI